MVDEILTITTGKTTPVEIDGKPYKLKSALDLSLSTQHRLIRLKERLSEIEGGKRKRNDSQWEKEYESADDQMVDGICDLFSERSAELEKKIKSLGVDQRVMIFQAVFKVKSKDESEKKTSTETTK